MITVMLTGVQILPAEKRVVCQSWQLCQGRHGHRYLYCTYLQSTQVEPLAMVETLSYDVAIYLLGIALGAANAVSQPLLKDTAPAFKLHGKPELTTDSYLPHHPIASTRLSSLGVFDKSRLCQAIRAPKLAFCSGRSGTFPTLLSVHLP
jgi:hypothetical protein